LIIYFPKGPVFPEGARLTSNDGVQYDLEPIAFYILKKGRTQMGMQFDPAMAAQQAFAKVRTSKELGDEIETAVAAEERFSSSAGEEASEAYRELLAIGARHPEASFFTEFLVYATWTHLMDETTPENFRRGLVLCQQLLQSGLVADDGRLKRLRLIEQSFRGGLGEKSEDEMGYDADLPKGGD
jgi:hypothetical protein